MRSIRKNKTIISLILVVLFPFSAFSCTDANQSADGSGIYYEIGEASWAYEFSSIEEMANDSRIDLIVSGEITGVERFNNKIICA